MCPDKVKNLQQLIKNMDLPIWRKTQDTPANFRWLLRNMGFRNSSHKNYEQARSILIELVKHGVRENEIQK